MLLQLCNEKLQDALADGAAAAPVAARPLKLKQVAPHAMADLYAQSRRRCDGGEPSPDADAAVVSPAPMQMRQG